MNLRVGKNLILLLAVLLMSVAILPAQPGQEGRYGLTVTDNGSETTKGWFGVAATGTYCRETSLGESELPPPPPTGVLDMRFIDHRSGGGACLGEGQLVHLQAEALGVTDTFQLKYQPGAGGFPMTIAWLGPLSDNFSSCRLVDLFGGILVNVDMLANPNAVITNGAITQLMIISTRKSATLIPFGVKQEKPGFPESFALKQNYPNPFNPSTTIAFNIEKTAFTEVIIYDMAGRKVATLASEQINPGFYSVEWNGRSDEGAPAASGVYYARMTATGEGVDFSSVRKLLLMK